MSVENLVQLDLRGLLGRGGGTVYALPSAFLVNLLIGRMHALDDPVETQDHTHLAS